MMGGMGKTIALDNTEVPCERGWMVLYVNKMSSVRSYVVMDSPFTAMPPTAPCTTDDDRKALARKTLKQSATFL